MNAKASRKAVPTTTSSPETVPDGATDTSSAESQASPGQASHPGSNVTSGQGRIHWRRLLQRRLLIRVTVPTLIGLVQLVIAIVTIVTGDAPIRVLLWTLPALAVGYLFGHSTKIGWDDDKAQITLIKAQLMLTVAYIAVRIGSHVALERTLGSRTGIADVLLLVSFGLFVGRTVGLAGQIRQALSSRSKRGHTGVTPS